VAISLARPTWGSRGGALGPVAGTDDFHFNSVASGGDYLLSAKWLTDFRFAYYSIYNDTVAQNFNQPLGNQLGIPNANGTDLNLYGGLPQFNITAPAATGANGGGNLEYGQNTNPSLEEISQFQIVNNWSHTIGNHNIKFGVDYRYGKAYLVSVESNALRSGTYFANNTRTSGVDGSGNQSTGLGFATFLLGDSTLFWRTETANVNAQSRQNRFFSYVQDQWRATQRSASTTASAGRYILPRRLPLRAPGACSTWKPVTSTSPGWARSTAQPTCRTISACSPRASA